jgi:leader peptidase (prepilin peptidase) / N-methyltransferase
MTLLQLLETDTTALIVATVMLGLMVGSFLNVVVYRLPIMMEHSWRQESTEYLGLATEPATQEPSINLLQPPSRCPNCAAPVRPWQNIPIISFLLLGGKCANCKIPIPLRYPAVEAITAIFSACVVWHFGFTVQAGAALILTWALISLSLIDIDHQILPDSITLPLLWIGMGLSVPEVFTTSHAAIIGAISGYLSLWIVYHVFRILTGKEGMGFGDFKLLAMLGAWMGWQYLPVIILFSSLVGALTGSLMILFGRQSRSAPIPFGPYLSAAGWTALLWGEEILRGYTELAG